MAPDRPMNSRGTPITRFNPLRDAPGAENDVPDSFGWSDAGEDASFDPRALISAVRREIVALGSLDTANGAMALAAAEKASEANGSAAAACLHELRMIMTEIKAGRAPENVGDSTEDVLSRKRRERPA